MPIVAAAAAAAAWLAVTDPLYRSTALVSVDRHGAAFVEPEDERANGAEDALRSQIQLVRSRELGRQAVRRLDLAGHPEFAPEEGSRGTARLFTLIGASRDRARLSPEEQVLERFHERLAVAADNRSRVLAIDFVSHDPALAAQAANAVAEAYIALQRSAWQEASPGSDQLSGEIETLRVQVAEADRQIEAFRRENGLAEERDGRGGAPSLRGQELSELTSQLSRVRGEKSAAEARARLIRQMLEAGAPLETGAVLNSPLIERLGERKARVRGQLAELSSTLGPMHPRMRGLNAELGDLRIQAREEGERIVRAAEADAQLAAQSESELREAIDALKAEASELGGPELQLNLLEHEAQAQRERLQSLLTRAAAEGVAAQPVSPRIVTRASPAEAPFYPRPILVMLAAVFGAAVIGGSVAGALELRTRKDKVAMRMPETVSAPAASLAARLEIPGSTGRAPQTSPSAAKPDLDAIARAIAAPPSGGSANVVLATSLRRLPDTAEVALRLARKAAADGQRVVLVDTRFNEAIPALNGSSRPGSLAELISGRGAFESAVTRDPGSRVHVIPSGKTEASPLALVSSDRMEMVLEALSQTYNVVVLLAPALNRHGELRVLANWAGSAVLTMHSGETESETATAEARRRLGDLGIKDVALVTVDQAAADAPAHKPRAA